jgi:hypothetical protein
MNFTKMGEADGGIKPHRPLLAHSLAKRMRLHVGTNLRRLQTVMARVAGEPNGFWRALAIGAMGLIIMMLGAFLAYQVAKTDGIETAVNQIKVDIALIQQQLEIERGR